MCPQTPKQQTPKHQSDCRFALATLVFGTWYFSALPPPPPTPKQQTPKWQTPKHQSDCHFAAWHFALATLLFGAWCFALHFNVRCFTPPPTPPKQQTAKWQAVMCKVGHARKTFLPRGQHLVKLNGPDEKKYIKGIIHNIL